MPCALVTVYAETERANALQDSVELIARLTRAHLLSMVPLAVVMVPVTRLQESATAQSARVVPLNLVGWTVTLGCARTGAPATGNVIMGNALVTQALLVKIVAKRSARRSALDMVCAAHTVSARATLLGQALRAIARSRRPLRTGLTALTPVLLTARKSARTPTSLWSATRSARLGASRTA